VLWEGRAAYLQMAALSRFQKLFKTTVKAKGEQQLYPEVFGRTNLGTAACNTWLCLPPCVIATLTHALTVATLDASCPRYDSQGGW
jgi:hypothetical protein